MITARIGITAAVSGVFAGGVAVGVTALVERFGGVLGGVAGTMPTTIMAASVGLAISAVSAEQIINSLYSVPSGVLLSSLFLMLWRELPSTGPIARIQRLGVKLAVMITITIGIWLALAAGVSALLTYLKSIAFPMRVVGPVCALGIATAGTLAAVLKHVPAPAGKKKVTPFNYVLRGILAALAVGVSVLLSSLNPIVAGILSVFPAIFLTAMVSLWVSQGQAVPAGAAAPMMLGCTSVSLHSMLFAELFALLHFALGWHIAAAAALATVLAFVLAVCCGSLPAFFFLRWINARHMARAAASDRELLVAGEPKLAGAETLESEAEKQTEADDESIMRARDGPSEDVAAEKDSSEASEHL